MFDFPQDMGQSFLVGGFSDIWIIYPFHIWDNP
jgi:hypothetical protein